MALSSNFKARLAATLKRELKKYSIIDIKIEHEKIICGYLSIFSDCRIKLRTHDIEVFIEAESKRIDPVYNLIKTLIWLDENKPNHFVILLHVFDESYVMEDKPRKAMCDFVYRNVQSNYKNFIYCPLNVSGLTQCNSPHPAFPMKKICDRITQVTKRLVDAHGVRLVTK